MPRFAELAHVFRPDSAKQADILASFRRYYFDTALSSSPAALPSLKAFAENGHILFGTDFPLAPADVASYFTTKLDDYEGLTPEEHRAISHGNRGRCFRVSLNSTHRRGLPQARNRCVSAISWRNHETNLRSATRSQVANNVGLLSKHPLGKPDIKSLLDATNRAVLPAFKRCRCEMATAAILEAVSGFSNFRVL
jgi:hypothetical protein